MELWELVIIFAMIIGAIAWQLHQKCPRCLTEGAAVPVAIRWYYCSRCKKFFTKKK